MPHMNGFQMLEQLTTIDFEIIFTTSYDQYAITAFKFSALDYLLKPVDREELEKAVQKVSKKINPAISQQLEILMQKINQPSVPVNESHCQQCRDWNLYRSNLLSVVLPATITRNSF